MGTGRGQRAAVLDQLAESDPERAAELAELRHHDPQAYRKAMRRLGRELGVDVPIRGLGSLGGGRRVGAGAGLEVEAGDGAAEGARAVAAVKAVRARKKKAEEPAPEPVEEVEEKTPKKRTKKKEA
jgi:hypothetical protein